MEYDYILPVPTEDELNLGQRLEYFERLKDMGLEKKYNITKDELSTWIFHNYQSVFLLNEELTLESFKNLKII